MRYPHPNKAFFTKISLQSLAGLILLGFLVFIFQGCQPEKAPVEQEFEDLVNAVEEAVENQQDSLYQHLTMQYDSLRMETEQQRDQFSTASQRSIERLERRYQQAADRWEIRLQTTGQSTQSELDELEAYLAQLESNIERESVETWQDVDAEYDLRRERLLETTEALSESMQNRLATLDKRFENAKSAWEQTQPVAKGDK
jgi:hypothetical protein